MKRILQKAVCIAMSLWCLAGLPHAARAETKTGYVAGGTALSAEVCDATGCGWRIIGSLAAGEVTVLSEQDGYYFVSSQGRQGFVDKGSVSFTAPAAAATTATTATTAATAATAAKSAASTKKLSYGHVVNCKEWVNINRTADKDALGKVYKNDLLAILGTSGEYTKVKTMKNTTGYVKSSYIEEGVLFKGDEVLSDPMKVESTENSIWLRCTPDASTSSSNIHRKLSGMKGEEFLAVAENGDWYLLKYEDCTGYGKKADFTK